MPLYVDNFPFCYVVWGTSNEEVKKIVTEIDPHGSGFCWTWGGVDFYKICNAERDWRKLVHSHNAERTSLRRYMQEYIKDELRNGAPW